MPGSWLASYNWKSFSRYELAEQIALSRGLVGIGEPVREYDLSDESLHLKMLFDYLKIRDQDAAAGWCLKWGLPDTYGITYGAMVQSAISTRWLWKLHREIRTDPFKLRQVVSIYDEQHKECFDRENDLLKGRVLFSKFEKYGLLGDGPIIVTFSPKNLDGWRGVYKTPRRRIGYDTPFPQESKIACSTEKEFLEENLDNELVCAAKFYLSQALNEILEDVAIEITWTSSREKREMILRSSFKISSPWEAMYLAMHKQVTGAESLRECPHPKCADLFIPTRRDRMCCGKESCQKWVTRQKNRDK